MDGVLTVAVVAAGVTKAVDLVKNLYVRWRNGPIPKQLTLAVSFVASVGAAYLLDAAGYVVTDGGPTTWATGVGIAGLASGWHEVFHFVSTKAHGANKL